MTVRLTATIALIAALLTGDAALPSKAAAQEAAQPPGTLLKFVILSRHGVRSPIPKKSELESWTKLTWPTWSCPTKDDPKRECQPGELTPRGAQLAGQMGKYYGKYLSSLFPGDQCPEAGDVFFWADVDERTKDTGLALLRGFRASCDPTKYFHTLVPQDRIFRADLPDTGGRCQFDPARAEREILARAGGSLSHVVTSLQRELDIAQHWLQCCRESLCQTAWTKTCRWSPPPQNACTLTSHLPSCVVATSTKAQTGGSLRVGSTFAEILLLEYANFPDKDPGWGIPRADMISAFRVHTTVFDLEQRTPYVATLQGSLLLKKILLALKNEDDSREGTAPAGAKFVAYVGHDTNIANLGGMLDLIWHQPPDYQPNQMPPAGALTFEVRETSTGIPNLYVAYVAQSLDTLRGKEDRTLRTAVSVPGCSTTEPGFPCPLDRFEMLVNQKLDPNCAQ